ncbi:MAG: glycerol kinase GlpK, partial [Bdellovibrio sp.]
PRPGWVEHDPERIWHSVVQGIQEVSLQYSLRGLQAIGITNQRETLVLWEPQNQKPLHPAIVWQDRRTQGALEKLKKKNWEKKIQARTGLLLDPYFSASKLQWLLQQNPTWKKRDLACGTIDTYILAKLTQGRAHATDVSNASRTMLMDLKSLQWSDELCRLFQVPAHFLPQILPSNASFGVTRAVPGLPDGVPITGILGDQQAALFGQGAWSEGDAKCTFGTGSFVLLNTGKKLVRSKSRLLSTLAWQLQGADPVYALEGGAFVCGAAVQWLRDSLKIIHNSSEVEALARSVSDSEGVIFVPALAGLGAPHWVPQARACLLGLTRGSTSAHIARATLEAMALQNVELFRAMEKDTGKRMRRLRVDGGACANSMLMQMQADYSGLRLQRPKDLESTTRGAFLMAALGAGLASAGDLKKYLDLDQEFIPQLSPKERQKKLEQWTWAVRSLIAHSR